ncbi:MAG: hypothetical protein KTR25_19340 [Myxococcales bacterium]|nr:hypothetical protein [Myxococcales bacterium]
MAKVGTINAVRLVGMRSVAKVGIINAVRLVGMRPVTKMMGIINAVRLVGMRLVAQMVGSIINAARLVRRDGRRPLYSKDPLELIL